MIHAIDHNWPVPPADVTYNGVDLPMAYSPVGLYLGAAWSRSLGVSPIEAVTLLPVAISIATIPAAYLLFRRLLDTELRAVIATAAFAAMPISFETLVVGGGITRAPGMLFAILSLVVGIDAIRADRPGRKLIFGGLLVALTALSHPQAGIFTGVSVIVFGLFEGPSKSRGLLRAGLLAGLGLFCASPWLAMVLLRSGPSVVFGAAQTSGSLLESLALLAGLGFSHGYFEVLGIVGVFGLVVAAINRRWLLPTWMVVTLLASSRAGANYGSLVLSAGCAYAVADLLRILRREEPGTLRGLSRAPFTVALLLAIATAAVADSAAASLRPLSPLHGLSTETRDALSWIEEETDEDDVILVLSGTAWFIDSASEWLPVLSGRRSSATVQGSEWQGPGAFDTRVRRFVWIQSCAAEGRTDCVTQWQQVVEKIDYVLLLDSRVARTQGTQCCLDVATRLVQEGGEVVFSNQEAVVVALSRSGETAFLSAPTIT
jgi:hypothetical protein